MRISRFKLTVLCMLLPVSMAYTAGRKNYSWPLKYPVGINATFSEYRVNHFHGGIDLSTGGKNGRVVRAVSPGSVYRIKIKKRGYGNALYIRHVDGNISVYAHLAAFSPKIQKYVETFAKKSGTRYLDIYPEQGDIPIQLYERIGFTGESGAGVSHLHFEIRNARNEPRNPFLFYPDMKDSIPPRPVALVIRPAGLSSLVDGSLREKIYALENKNGVFSPKKNLLTLSGPVRFEITAYDRAGKHSGKLIPFRIVLYVDGEMSFERIFKQFRFEPVATSGFVYDHARSNLGPTRFTFNLFQMEDDPTLDVIGQSMVNLTPGVHEVKILLEDFQKNKTYVKFSVRVPEDISTPVEGIIPPEGIVERQRLVFPLAGDIPGAGQVAWRDGTGQSVLYPVKKASNGQRFQVLPSELFRYVPVTPENHPAITNIRWFKKRKDRNFRVQGDGWKVSLYGFQLPEDSILRIRTSPGDKWKGLLPESPRIIIEPGNTFFLHPASLRVEKGRQEDATRVGVYSWNPWKKAWVYQDTTREKNLFSVKIRKAGTFMLLRDTIPPTFGRVRFRYDWRKKPELLVEVRDIGSGIDDEKISVRFSGKSLKGEYDPDRKWIRIALATRPRGRHLLRVTIRDRAGNRGVLDRKIGKKN